MNRSAFLATKAEPLKPPKNHGSGNALFEGSLNDNLVKKVTVMLGFFVKENPQYFCFAFDAHNIS
jgi:hypothetical protein